MQIQSRGRGLDPPSKIASTRLVSIKKWKKRKKEKKDRFLAAGDTPSLDGGDDDRRVTRGRPSSVFPRQRGEARLFGAVDAWSIRRIRARSWFTPPINNAPLCASAPILSRESVHVEADVDRPGFRLGHRSVKLSIPCLERCYAENGVEMRVISDWGGKGGGVKCYLRWAWLGNISILSTIFDEIEKKKKKNKSSKLSIDSWMILVDFWT